MSLINKSLTVALLAGCVAGAGAFNSAWAGPEPIQTSAKDKEIQEIVPVYDPRWYVSLGGNADINFGGTDFNNAAHRSFAAPNGGTIDIDINSHDYNDVYDNPFYSIEGEVGYVLTSHIELFGTFRYTGSAGSDRVTGSNVFVDIPRIITGNIPLSTSFDDYSAEGGELGIRYFFVSKEKRWRPYVSLSGGVTHVDSIDFATHADVSAFGGPADVTLLRGRFYDDSWVGTGSALLGLEYRITCHWLLGVNAGVRYYSTLDGNDGEIDRFNNALQGTGIDLSFLKHINDDTGDRWTVPVTGYVKFRF